MLNRLTSKRPLLLASFFVATAIFGQNQQVLAKSCKPEKTQTNCSTNSPATCPPTQNNCPTTCPPAERKCNPLPEVRLIPAYSESARIDTTCPWDVYVDGSFTYWQPIQDNMEVALINFEIRPPLNLGNVSNGHILDMDYDYVPGFKVGIGVKLDHDKWDAHAEYTWFRSHNNVSSNGFETNANQLGEMFAINAIPALESVGNAFNSVSSSWRLNMDILDVEMGRWGYTGTSLTLYPYAGGRAAWIRQSVNTNFTSFDPLINTCLIDYISRQQIHSWAVGPEVGFNMNWKIGCGFRFISNVEGDLLYTNYKVSRNDSRMVHAAGASCTNIGWNVTQKDIKRIRSHIDMEIGLGFGGHFGNDAAYFDISAVYGFQVFFAQNMGRHFFSDPTDTFQVGNSLAPNGDLYIQGVTATAALHF